MLDVRLPRRSEFANIGGTDALPKVFIDLESADAEPSFQEPFQKSILTVDLLGCDLDLPRRTDSIAFQLLDPLLKFLYVGLTSRAEVALVRTISVDGPWLG